MERLKFIGKRLVYLVIMLFGVATLVFILTKLVPGDPVTANLSQRALGDPQIVAAYKAKYGLDQPIIVQYVYYMKNLLHFDLGTSIRTNNAVLSELARCYPATIELAVFAIILATLFGILFGVISAIKRNSILDQIVRAISVTGVSLPSFWFALLVLYFFYYKLQILPGPGRLGNAFSAPQTVTGFFVIDSLLEGDIPKALDALRHLILPGTVLAAFTMGLITRTTRSNLLDVMSTDYIRTARAKGLSNVRLIIHHALGASRIRILLKEIIPNSITSVLIMATTDIGNQILMFSTLSFLGLGSAPPTPEWGMMVSDGVQYFNKFWVAGFPGLAIFTMAVGANFIGDGLRDLLDPKLRKQF